MSPFPRRILIADHREPAFPEVGRILTALGHTIASSGALSQSVEIVRERRPDMIMLIPASDASAETEVNQVLAARSGDQHTPLLLITDAPVDAILESSSDLVDDIIPFTGSSSERICDRVQLALARLLLTRGLEEQLRSVERQSITDFKTGTFNDRYFHRRLRQEFGRAQRYRSSISCVMLDFDNFKEINDSFDHAFGDFVLLAFAKKVRGIIRDSDIPARFGGDEFVILLPNTRLEEAVRIAERIRSIVSAYSFELEERATSVTVSIGISTFDGVEDASPEEFLRRADCALLEAKRRGRNRVVLYTQVAEQHRGSTRDRGVGETEAPLKHDEAG